LEFLGVGYQEILVILILLLVVVGPERLPQMAYQIGRAVRQMQRYARAVRDEFSDEMQYLEEQYNTVRGDIEEARGELEREQRQLDQDMRQLDTEVKAASREIEESVPDEMKKDGRGNVIPISSAASQKGTNTNRPSTTRTATQPAPRTSTAATTSNGRRETGPATPAEQKKPDEAKSSDDGAHKPPLVF
jgi:sec-independent protein translocase protein TatB